MAPPFKHAKKKAESQPGLKKLTKAQQRLVKYPPTPKTWRCTKKRQQEGAETGCGFVNSGRARTCGLCGSTKPSKPALLWPEYLAACKKAGITPEGVE